MKKNNKIPVSNYISLFLIICITIVGSLYFRNVYLSSKDYNDNIPIIRDNINHEINSKEIYNYIRENNNSIIYVGVSSDELCRSYENELKKIISKYHLEEDITYLNLSDLKNAKTFIKEFNKFYDSSLKSYPSIIIFENSSVIDILSIENSDNYYNKTINFLLENEVGLNVGD